MRAATPLSGRQRSAIRSSRGSVRAPLQVQSHFGGLLQRHVAGREGVRVAEAKEEENVRRPWTDPFDRDQRLVGVLGVEIGKALKIEAALEDRLGERVQSADFGVGQSAGAQVLFCRLGDFGRLERNDERLQSAENGGGAGRRHLLRHDDRSQPRKARLPAAKRRRAADRDQTLDEFRVFGAQALGGFPQRRLIVDRGTGMVDPFLRRTALGAPGCSDRWLW